MRPYLLRLNCKQIPLHIACDEKRDRLWKGKTSGLDADRILQAWFCLEYGARAAGEVQGLRWVGLEMPSLRGPLLNIQSRHQWCLRKKSATKGLRLLRFLERTPDGDDRFVFTTCGVAGLPVGLQ